MDLQKNDSGFNQRKRILNLLRKNEFVPTAQLRLFSYQYNARIYELRKAGWHILATKQDGRYGFELTGSK